MDVDPPQIMKLPLESVSAVPWMHWGSPIKKICINKIAALLSMNHWYKIKGSKIWPSKKRRTLLPTVYIHQLAKPILKKFELNNFENHMNLRFLEQITANFCKKLISFYTLSHFKKILHNKSSKFQNGHNQWDFDHGKDYKKHTSCISAIILAFFISLEIIRIALTSRIDELFTVPGFRVKPPSIAICAAVALFTR